MSFPRYSANKESGVEWIGQIPAHWQVTRLANLGGLSKANGGTKEDSTESGVPCVRYGDLYTKYDHAIRTVDSFVSPDAAESYTPIKRGDVLFAASGETFEDIGKSAVYLGREHACCGGDVILLRPIPGLDLTFLGYALDCSVSRAQKSRMGRGFTVKHIYADGIRDLLLTLPPLEEQRAIATFLDRETAKIDALVKEQERLVELLEEKRSAAVARAVTKGLKPNVRLVDSRAEWLGHVPEDWTVLRLAALFQDCDERGDDSLPILSVSIHDGVSDDELSEKELDRKVARSDDRTKYKRVRPGDLVYNMMRAWQGAFGTVTVDGMVSPAYVVARPRDGVPTWLVERVLRTPSAVEEMRRFSRGITDFRMRLYWEEFKNVRVAIPPVELLIEIKYYVDEVETRTAELVAAAGECIDLLLERRSALISAAVTGKIDVRGHVHQPAMEAA